MAVVSGKDGKVKIGSTEVADVTKWSATRKTNATHYASSSTNGWRKACAGIDEVTGDFEAKLQDSSTTEPIATGTVVTLELIVGSQKWSGSAMITEVGYEVDLEGAPVSLKASFISDGPWTFGSST